MNNIFRITGIALVIIIGVFSINTTLANESQNITTPDEHSHEHEKPTKELAHDHDHANDKGNNPENLAVVEDEHEVGVTLSTEKINLAGIKVNAVFPRAHLNTVYAPGEVKANGYKSYIVSPRTDSVVINRHASLGDHVKFGQQLVTLFSETMAQTQADFLIASSNWKRTKKLGTNNISERALVEAENIYKGVFGKLVAFGLTKQAIETIAQQDSATFGQYDLVAEREGVVLQDDFMQGQRIEAGETIMLLADEKDLWVEANVPPNKELNLSLGSPALIDLNGFKYQANVIQEAHTIDPITRTRIVRLSITNPEHKLHSGMFVKVYFQFESSNEVIAVPEEALIRSSDGDWTVFIEDHPNEFKAVEVTRGRSFGDYCEVLGIEAGTKVVTRGAFFVASEIAKGGFDPHNH
ncbi:efflux RND transporter periplasmic adaptor subunit [Psychrosphaera sp. B3R10]|uniref:efflux RND transporter periplasmic adaptor subunit n=1 Tax=unclassified Psychrosphaera TaxID=2641570 RepID=UPI001C095C84|nr:MULTISPECIES: efflux RND transporter periplasmic adaptor subunit [unclassified Psychrosphaera]MBU2882766.1 efflux RND transporter periplasmic adaptor subunit [Psychrosphaera sp. I2R16]MBU2989216.1 efflux RND transporter periplasmic adaptor subunit [Psychrosphaera sp. B3R10]